VIARAEDRHALRCASARRAVAVLLVLLVAAGCASQAPQAAGHAPHRWQAASGPGVGGDRMKRLAADYLAIALPANRRLDHEVDAYKDHAHDSLTVAESALRAEAATERQFDQLLLRIPFPAAIAATAHDLVRVNQDRIGLTERQAQVATIASLLSFTIAHKAADAVVEVQVRIIRRELGLPPPENS